MTRRDDGDDVVFGGLDRPFRRERAMVLGGGVLEGEGDGDKVVGEVRGGFVVEEKMGERVCKNNSQYRYYTIRYPTKLVGTG